MTTLFIVILALLPIGVLGFYINYKDKERPEPIKLLLKTFFYGVLSVFVSLCISMPFKAIGIFSDQLNTLWDSVSTAFFGAAIPEEIAKFLMLWLVLRNNKYFDEKMDGIVYAVCVSLGFAAFENLLYLFQNAETFVAVGIGRALFSVPGHFCFGILMGYYFSLARFSPISQKRNYTLALVAPILVHGIFDALLFISNVTPAIGAIVLLAFLVFYRKMWKYASKKITEHLQLDNSEALN